MSPHGVGVEHWHCHWFNLQRHNECCSAPSPRLVPAGDLYERHNFTKRKNQTVHNRVVEFVSQLYNNIMTIGELTRMLILEQNVTKNSMCIAAAKYLSSGLPTACAGPTPTQLAIAPAKLHHGSSEFLEFPIHP